MENQIYYYYKSNQIQACYILPIPLFHVEKSLGVAWQVSDQVLVNVSYIHLTSQNPLYSSPLLLVADESVSLIQANWYELPADFQPSMSEGNFYQYRLCFHYFLRKVTSLSLQDYAVLCCGFHIELCFSASWASPVMSSPLFLFLGLFFLQPFKKVSEILSGHLLIGPP